MLSDRIDCSIDKNIPVPLYYQLKQHLLRAIASGALGVGDKLPSENELCAALDISRPTVRQAISELAAEGYLARQKGRGVFVTKPKIEDRFFQTLESFNREMLQKGLRPSTLVLEKGEQAAAPYINRQLAIGPGDRLLCVERLRFADEDPIVLLKTYLPLARFAGLLQCDLERSSLYELMEERFGVRVTRAVRRIEAASATSREARLLNIPKSQPVCLVHTVAYGQDGVPAEYSVAKYRGDRNQFTIELHR